MAHKTLIGGTVYEIGGGKDLIGGTVYEKDHGKTLVGGTVYEVGFAKPVTITIEGSGSTYAYVVIDGVQYNTATTVEVPIGAVITCVTSHADGAPSSGIIRVDYRTVAQEVKATYDYTVVSDATITLSDYMPNHMVTYVVGRIEIVDANAPYAATVTIARTGVTSGGAVGKVTIDGYPYAVSTSVNVPLGTVVVCSAPWTSHQMYGSYGGQIKLNGTLVADRVSGVAPTTYEYTVNKNVQIDLVGVGSPNGVFANINITEL